MEFEWDTDKSNRNKEKLAKNTKEFDQRFDSGEDILDLIDLSNAKIIRRGEKVRITIEIDESLFNDIDNIRKQTGVDRNDLIQSWLNEKIKEKKAI